MSESRKLLILGLNPSGGAVNGRPINPAEYYSVATNDFLASGGDGYGMLASCAVVKRHERKPQRRSTLERYVVKRPPYPDLVTGWGV
jgi:2',3'-cyclic-nucleotide 2'-phosphodiesterase (5'-nucleotidase family)